MSKLSKLSKVDDSVTVHFYDNGFMVEVAGRDKREDWATAKILCQTIDEVVEILNEAKDMERS